MSPDPQSVVKPIAARGKALLIKAALKLAVKTRSIAALGVREIGREAGLNPNTFYRHFSSLEDLGLSLIDEVANNLRRPLREIRRQSAEAVTAQLPTAESSTEYWELCLRKGKLATRQNIDHYFAFVVQNPEAFMIAVSELNGSSPKLRRKLQNILGDLTMDLVEDIRIHQLLPMLSDKSVLKIATISIRHMFALSIDYLDYPEKREEILKQSYSLMIGLVAGSIALDVSDNQTMLSLISVLRQEVFS